MREATGGASPGESCAGLGGKVQPEHACSRAEDRRTGGYCHDHMPLPPSLLCMLPKCAGSVLSRGGGGMALVQSWGASRERAQRVAWEQPRPS